MIPTRHCFFCVANRHESITAAAAVTFAVLLLFIGISFSPTAQGQAVYGSIAGTVYNSSGAGVPRATVNITDLQKNVSYTTTTNESATTAKRI